jgi:hypothetical protein
MFSLAQRFRQPVRDAGLAMLRTSWEDPEAIFVGIKAGQDRNGRGHTHLGLGSFILEAGGARWALDLGRDDYNLPEPLSSRTAFRLTWPSCAWIFPGRIRGK